MQQLDPLSTADGPELHPRAGDADAVIHVPASAAFYEAAIEGLTLLDEQILENSPDFPRLYESGVVYRKEAKDTWRHADDVLCSGWGDCEDLASWRVAELRVTREDPDAYVYVYQSGPHRYHAVVARGSGRIEDPSLILGMQVSDERRKKLPKFVGQEEGRFPDTTRAFGSCPRAAALLGDDSPWAAAIKDANKEQAAKPSDEAVAWMKKHSFLSHFIPDSWLSGFDDPNTMRAFGSCPRAMELSGVGEDMLQSSTGRETIGDASVGWGWSSFNPMRAVRAAESVATRAVRVPFGALRTAENAARMPFDMVSRFNPFSRGGQQAAPPVLPGDNAPPALTDDGYPVDQQQYAQPSVYDNPRSGVFGEEGGSQMCYANRRINGETIGDASSSMVEEPGHRCSINCPHVADQWKRVVRATIQGAGDDGYDPNQDQGYDPSQDQGYDPTQDQGYDPTQDPNAQNQQYAQGPQGPSKAQKVGQFFSNVAQTAFQPVKFAAQVAYQPIRLGSKLLSTGATVAKGATNLAMLPLKGISKLFSLFGEEDFRGGSRPNPALMGVEDDDEYEDGDEEVFTHHDLFAIPEAEDEDYIEAAELSPQSQRMRFQTAEVAPGMWGGRVLIPRGDEPGRAFSMYTSPSRTEREAAERMRNLAMQAANNPGLQLAVSPAALVTMAAMKLSDATSGGGKIAGALRSIGRFVRIEG